MGYLRESNIAIRSDVVVFVGPTRSSTTPPVGAALLVPPRDVDALAGALDMTVNQDAGLAGPRQRGLTIAARHTWERTAAAHAEVYRAESAAR